MGLPKVSARNSVQVIPTIPLNERKVNESPAEFYTCPTGKKARIRGQCTCTGLGAATEVRLQADGVSVLLFIAVDVTNQASFPFDVRLDAGETLAKDQNSGTNGELNVNAAIQESPA